MADVRHAVVCDDDAMIAAIASMLLQEAGFDVTATGSKGELAVALGIVRPEVIVLDHELPDGPGEEAIGTIRAAAPACRIILFSAHDDAGPLPDGVFARVSKRGTDELAAAIDRAVAGAGGDAA